MFVRALTRVAVASTCSNCRNQWNVLVPTPNSSRPSPARYCNKSENTKDTEIVIHGSFEDLENKNKETYLDMIRIFVNRDSVYRRGHVEFIYAALKNMESFGVSKDLEVYKALIDVLPKGRFIPTNIFQVEFMHYPKQQQCVIDLLEQMEDSGVMPDYDMEALLKNIFGSKGFPLRKYWRMMYWMPKFKNASPWPIPSDLPNSVLEQAKCAIQRITSVDLQTEIKVYEAKEIEDSIDDTWIVSAQSPTQKRLLEKHVVTEPVYVEGSYRVWLKHNQVNYFMLRRKPTIQNVQEEDLDDVSKIRVPLFRITPPVKKHLSVVPTVHEQDDGVILAVCATGTSSKDSLLSWIRHLEKDGNPILASVPIVFTLRTGTKEIATVDHEQKEKITEK